MENKYGIIEDDIRCNECLIKGDCCYSSILIRDMNLILTKHPCKFLNLETKKCRVYKKRQKKVKDCLSIIESLEIGALPKECYYAQEFLRKGFKPTNPFKERIDTNLLAFHPKFLYDHANDAPHKKIRNYKKPKIDVHEND